MKRTLFPILMACLALVGCGGSESDKNQSNNTPKTTSELNVPEGFSFSTSSTVTVNITVQYASGAQASGVPVRVYRELAEEAVPTPSDLLFSGITNDQGEFRDSFVLPQTESKVTVVASILGISNRVTLDATGGTISHQFGN